MAATNLRELRADAKRAGAEWSEVVALKNDLLALERERRELTDGPRRRAWELHTTPGCHPFWRCGWDRVRRRLENSGRDCTAVRGYDQIATAVAEEHPEWQGRDAEELFAFLFEPYEPWPPRLAFYEEALGQIEAQVGNVPF